ncbi:MAG: hypothetical protein RJA07_1439 [Bacteroidota bacterium]
MFKTPFSFDGRIRRKEYCLSLIIFIGCFSIIDICIDALPKADFLELLYIPLCWFILAQGTKRCHDKDKAGWYLIYPIYIFSMIFADGDKRENQYGQNPKENNIDL